MGISSNKNLRNELYPGGAKRIPLKDYNEMSKGVCKIIYKRYNKKATGFFLNDFSNGNKLLITNYHVISRDIIDSNDLIEIEIFDGKEYRLRLEQRHFKFFEKPDITVIQINDFNEICSSVKFLEIDLNYKRSYDFYLNKDVFILGYPFGNNIEYSPGKITSVSNYKLYHNCDTNFGSSGSPIILISNSLVVGIHKAGDEKKEINIGTFIGIILDEKLNLQKNVKKKKKFK